MGHGWLARWVNHTLDGAARLPGNGGSDTAVSRYWLSSNDSQIAAVEQRPASLRELVLYLWQLGNQD